MKNLKINCLYLILFLAYLLSSCQDEESGLFDIQPIKRNPSFSGKVNDKAPNPEDADTPLPPPPTVIREEFSQATGWRIEWDNPDWDKRDNYLRFFSTVDGSLHSFNSLNSGDWQTTAKVDMELLFGWARAPSEFSSLVHDTHVRHTKFKPSDMTLEELIDYTENNPAMFQELYVNSPNKEKAYQPFNYDAQGDDKILYKTGEIYLFKTDRFPTKYGAVRVVSAENIIQETSPRIIEVIIQKDVLGGLKF